MAKSSAVIVNGIEWTKESIRELLKTDDKAVSRGVFRIYEYQTSQEQMDDATELNNNVGFTGADAFILTQFAKFYIKTGFLTPKQIALARKRMLKYSSQLLRIMSKAQ